MRGSSVPTPVPLFFSPTPTTLDQPGAPGPGPHLVNHHALVAGEVWLGQELAEQHAICHVLDHRLF